MRDCTHTNERAVQRRTRENVACGKCICLQMLASFSSSAACVPHLQRFLFRTPIVRLVSCHRLSAPSFVPMSFDPSSSIPSDTSNVMQLVLCLPTVGHTMCLFSDAFAMQTTFCANEETNCEATSQPESPAPPVVCYVTRAHLHQQ